MSRDFAKRPQQGKSRRSTSSTSAKSKRSTKGRRTSDKQKAQNSSTGVRPFFAGVVTGVFLSFLAYLGTLSSSIKPELNPAAGPRAAQTVQPTDAASEEKRKPRFDFYKLLTEQTDDVDVEPAPDVGSPRSSTASKDVYVLQAGSFRQREDADRRRAQLLLLSLEPSIEETNGENGRWYRVYLGPFDSRSTMAKARSLTTQQEIKTLMLKRGQSE